MFFFSFHDEFLTFWPWPFNFLSASDWKMSKTITINHYLIETQDIHVGQRIQFESLTFICKILLAFWPISYWIIKCILIKKGCIASRKSAHNRPYLRYLILGDVKGMSEKSNLFLLQNEDDIFLRNRNRKILE